MTSIKNKVENQRVRVSMNVKHLTVRSAEPQLVQMENGQYREFAVRTITFHREDNGLSPWTRWYDLSNPIDAEDIAELRSLLEKHPHLADDINFRVRISGEFDAQEPWPGYDDQNAEQIIAYYNASHPASRPELEKMMSYELDRVDENGESITDADKVTAIESLAKKRDTTTRNNAKDGVAL